MATRSTIGIIHPDRSVTAVYCHSDGYPSHNGRLLMDHWSSTKKVQSLMKLGMLSVLGAVIGKKHDFEWRSDPSFQRASIQEQVAAINADPRIQYTRAFMRDRGDKDMEAYQMGYWNEQFAEEYVYLWCEVRETWLIGLWHCGDDANGTDSGLRWRLLHEVRSLPVDTQDENDQDIVLALTSEVALYPPSKDFEAIEEAQEAIALF